jgi:hypothetical protein
MSTEARQIHPEYFKQAQDQMDALLARSATDGAFRAKLIADPKAAVAEFTGLPIRDSFNVKFIENKADATIVLPDAVDPAKELSSQDLEAVAGGATPVVLSIIASALAVYDAIEDKYCGGSCF